MNINSIAKNCQILLSNQTNFKSARIVDHNAEDSFEKASQDDEAEVSYPRTFKYNPIRRKRIIEAQEKYLLSRMQRKCAEQQEIKKEFDELHSEMKKIIAEMLDISSERISNLQRLKKLITTEENEHAKESFIKIYAKQAQRLEQLVAEYEILQQRMQEIFETGKAEFANIPNIALDLAPVNVEYYKELASNIPQIPSEE